MPGAAQQPTEPQPQTAAEVEAEAAIAAEAERLQAAAAEHPAPLEDESVEDYVTRLREEQVKNTRTDR